MSKQKQLFRIIYHVLFAITSSIAGALVSSWPLLFVFVLVQKSNKTVNLTIWQVMHNYNQLLWYLVWPFQQHLRMDNLSTSVAAAQHFAAVKRLFVLALIVFLFCAVICLWGQRQKKHAWINRLDKVWALVFLLLPVVILPFAITNFDQFFILFHHLFFIGSNNWLFDPATDPVINVLTEGFFAACFAVGGLIYELYFAEKLLQH